ncbi:hypothetical protein WR25_26003 [Diploscapter pachys]|uniref:Uncharacterized protein n=1 Tax=Diploscapter pachys TaxID=2018661 RepID=A0A2A2K4J0_9BILA|nr:hypothetical protein WR25_26003 [Diploscapter pachys]
MEKRDGSKAPELYVLPCAGPLQHLRCTNHDRQCRYHGVRACLTPEYPEQRKRGKEHRHSKDAAQRGHPGAGAGESVAQRRHIADREERQRDPEAEACEHEQRGGRGQHDRGAECRTHERPRAGGGDECGEGAGGEGTDLASATRESGSGARCAQRDQRGAERDADADDAGGIGKRLVPRRLGRGAGAGKPDCLQRQDREDAGHDVEDQAAEDRGEEGHEDRHRRSVTAPRPRQRPIDRKDRPHRKDEQRQPFGEAQRHHVGRGEGEHQHNHQDAGDGAGKIEDPAHAPRVIWISGLAQQQHRALAGPARLDPRAGREGGEGSAAAFADGLYPDKHAHAALSATWQTSIRPSAVTIPDIYRCALAAIASGNAVKQLAATVQKGAAVHHDRLRRETPAWSAGTIDEAARYGKRQRRSRAARRVVDRVGIAGNVGVRLEEEIVLPVHGGSSRERGEGGSSNLHPPFSSPLRSLAAGRRGGRGGGSCGGHGRERCGYRRGRGRGDGRDGDARLGVGGQLPEGIEQGQAGDLADVGRGIAAAKPADAGAREDPAAKDREILLARRSRCDGLLEAGLHFDQGQHGLAFELLALEPEAAWQEATQPDPAPAGIAVGIDDLGGEEVISGAQGSGVARAGDRSARGQLAFALERIEAFAAIDDVEAIGLRYEQLEQRQRIDAGGRAAILCLGQAHEGAHRGREFVLRAGGAALLDQCDRA